jgi:hypothetical protein
MATVIAVELDETVEQTAQVALLTPLLTRGSEQCFRRVSMSPTSVEVTGFSPTEYLTGRVSANR